LFGLGLTHGFPLIIQATFCGELGDGLGEQAFPLHLVVGDDVSVLEEPLDLGHVFPMHFDYGGGVSVSSAGLEHAFPVHFTEDDGDGGLAVVVTSVGSEHDLSLHFSEDGDGD